MKKSITTLLLALIAGLGSLSLQAQDGQYEKADNPLFTPWAEEVSPENALPEYPRPQMRRDHWKNLNGLWDFQMTSKMGDPGEYEDEILVPYPVESALSGIKEIVGADHRVWYKRSFTVDNPYENGRVLLHFGAVDWESDV
ncbi:MAG: beta-galactosidase, partial [Bacteroidota bacterium]